MAVSKISLAFDYKFVSVSKKVSYSSGTTYYSGTLTSTDFTNAINAGYVPLAISAFNTGRDPWFASQISLSNSGVYMHCTLRTSSSSEGASATMTATVLMVKKN